MSGPILNSWNSGSDRHAQPHEALLNGLVFEQQGIANPYAFGFIGSSDTHTGASGVEEDDFVSKLDPRAARVGTKRFAVADGSLWSRGECRDRR